MKAPSIATQIRLVKESVSRRNYDSLCIEREVPTAKFYACSFCLLFE